VAAGVGVVLVALVAWFLGSAPEAPPAAVAVPGPAATSADLTPVPVPAAVPAPVAPAAPVTRRIEFVFAATSWVQVEAGGERVLDGEFPGGVTRTVEVAPPVDVILGNAPAVRMVVDGSAYTLPPGSQAAGSNVARFRLEAPAPAAAPAAVPAADTATPAAAPAGALPAAAAPEVPR
jgi:hypothetical protein